MASTGQRSLRRPRSTAQQYALKIPAGQTTGMEPRFCAGEMAIVDPGRSIEPGCDVLVTFADGDAATMCMLRRFVRRDRWAVWLRGIAEPDTAAVRFSKAAIASVHRIVFIGDWVD